MKVWDLVFVVWGSGFTIYSVWVRVYGLWYGLKCRVQDLLRVLSLPCPHPLGCGGRVAEATRAALQAPRCRALLCAMLGPDGGERRLAMVWVFAVMESVREHQHERASISEFG